MILVDRQVAACFPPPSEVYVTRFSPGSRVSVQLNSGDRVQTPSGEWIGTASPARVVVDVPQDGRLLGSRYFSEVAWVPLGTDYRESAGMGPGFRKDVLVTTGAEVQVGLPGEVPLVGWSHICVALVGDGSYGLGEGIYTFKVTKAVLRRPGLGYGSGSVGDSEVGLWDLASNPVLLASEGYTGSVDCVLKRFPWPSGWPKWGGTVADLTVSFEVSGATWDGVPAALGLSLERDA